MKIDIRGLKKIASDKQSTTFLTNRGHKFIVSHDSMKPGEMKFLSAFPHAEQPKKFANGGGTGFEEDTDQSVYAPQDAAPEVVAPPAPPAPPPERELSQKEKDYKFYKSSAADDPYYAQRAKELEAELYPPAAPENKFSAITPPLGAGQGKAMADMDAIRQQEGPVSGDDSADRSPDAVAPTDRTGGQPDEALPDQDEPPASGIQNTVADPAMAQDAASDKTAAQQYNMGFGDWKREHANYLGSEDAAWQQDLANGHVDRETYSDLFAKKDTLGKIGTLFGLLVSGAGSGLAHQQNAVLSAMDKEIDGDYNAMSASKSNAQNYLKIHQQQALNAAEIARMKAGIPLTEAEAKKAQAEASVLGQSAMLMAKNRAAFHHLSQMVQTMPPGPQRVAAERALFLTGQAVDAKNMDVSDVASSKAALVSAMGGPGGGGDESNFQQQQKFLLGSGDPTMAKLAEYNQETHIPGVGQASGAVPQGKKDELEAMNVLDYKAKDLLQYAKQHKGSLDPSVRAVGAQKAEEMMNYYNNSIKGGVMTEGRLKWLDQQIKKNPTSIFQDVLGNNARLSEIMQSNAQRRNLMLQNLGAPQSSPPSVAGSQGQEGAVSTSKSGKPIVFRGGKWHYK